MSTIVAVVGLTSIAIAADTLSSKGDQVTGALHHPSNKIITIGDSFVGIAGAASATLAIVDFFGRGSHQTVFGSVSEIYRAWVALHAALRMEYYLIPNADEETGFESTQMDVLIVNATGAYIIDEYRSVRQIVRYHAVGSGERYALGAMEILYCENELGPEAIAVQAVEAASEFNVGTSLPVTVHSVLRQRVESQQLRRRRT
jgi:ATP-dependent HslUV protease, peptidase subunit HslV